MLDCEWASLQPFRDLAVDTSDKSAAFAAYLAHFVCKA